MPDHWSIESRKLCACEPASRKIQPLRQSAGPLPGKRSLDQKARGTVVMQQKAALMRPAAQAARNVEKLVIGGKHAGERYKR